MNKKIILVTIVAFLLSETSAMAATTSSITLPQCIKVPSEASYILFKPLWDAMDGLCTQIKNIKLIPGPTGPAGLSCWDLNKDNACNLATEDINHDGKCDTLDCKGATGATGSTGAKGETGATGTTGATGANGKSAYEVAQDNGFQGTAPQWLASLVGPKGETGATGATGVTGAKGDKGDKGDTGECSCAITIEEYNALVARVTALEVNQLCFTGQTQDCYTGYSWTKGVGVCHGGTQTCNKGVWGDCIGEVIPTPEVCNGLDDDCNGWTDEFLGTITCGVGICTRTVQKCVDGALKQCVPGSPSPELCNGLDDDCNGQVDNDCGCVDNDGDGFYALRAQCPTGTDCNDAALNIHPGAVELCNGLDDNCDGNVDENAVGCGSYICSNGACLTYCAGDGDCSSGYYCSTGTCVAKQSDGNICTSSDACLSGWCVGNHCCGAGLNYCNGVCMDTSSSLTKCAVLGATCVDCTSAGYRLCVAGQCQSSCTDKIKNGPETDVDCGGGTCPACQLTKACNINSDCMSNTCTNHICTT